MNYFGIAYVEFQHGKVFNLECNVEIVLFVLNCNLFLLLLF